MTKPTDKLLADGEGQAIIGDYSDIRVDFDDPDKKLTMPPPPTYLATVLPDLTEAERKKIIAIFDCSDTPTALIPQAEDPDTGNFDIPKLKPISDAHALSAAVIAETTPEQQEDAALEVTEDPSEDTGQTDLFELLNEGKNKSDLVKACDFLAKHDFDAKKLINSLFMFEFDGNQLEIEEISAVLTFFLRNLLILFMHFLKGNLANTSSRHKLARLAERPLISLAEGPQGGNVDRNQLIHELENVLNPLMECRPGKRERLIYNKFLESIEV